MSSSNSVNSTWMYNMETMPKMEIIIRIILIAIMMKVFNYFHSSALINLKSIKPIKNLSKANDEGSSHFWFIFYLSWELLYLTSNLFCYLYGKYYNDVCIFLLEITLIKKCWNLIGSEHYSSIITWYCKLMRTWQEHYINII